MEVVVAQVVVVQVVVVQVVVAQVVVVQMVEKNISLAAPSSYFEIRARNWQKIDTLKFLDGARRLMGCFNSIVLYWLSRCHETRLKPVSVLATPSRLDDG